AESSVCTSVNKSSCHIRHVSISRNAWPSNSFNLRKRIKSLPSLGISLHKPQGSAANVGALTLAQIHKKPASIPSVNWFFIACSAVSAPPCTPSLTLFMVVFHPIINKVPCQAHIG